MCECASCVLTDSYADKGFDAWPKAEGINRSARKDKVYTAHWATCGAEANKQRATLDMRMHLGGKAVPRSVYADLAHYQPYWQPIAELDEVKP